MKSQLNSLKSNAFGLFLQLPDLVLKMGFSKTNKSPRAGGSRIYLFSKEILSLQRTDLFLGSE